MRLILFVAMSLALSIASSEARIRVDRPCDLAQDHPERFNFNPDGGNAIMLRGCGRTPDAAADDMPSRAEFWDAFSCGYFAYRNEKSRGANPYRNKTLNEFWTRGWDEAARACTSGRLPFQGE